ncbi:hypothetical protein R69608_06274 [Paraburkholderia nemoris]|uniref:Uncharacterized protein n=1 Tax=Paraburkholderia nemoris TaxID=2793076 RepID=A0ABN7N7Z7_9BURK|nr:hypothetical protein R69619_06388 [Paraburkholderia nemoris]CAE6842645.1 hypothetical protein R75777_07147 [Paraburkholderia nemoris]CAE6851157.1 hypothetical protein R69776_07507 [Paraburkholderia nemoris]CAE6859919.1 hypothetical protein R69749_05386 [Paraburkholderia domus]CAE6958140.1 hypothetical protein R69608_06274 [Paraburkholderia nemoris]
MSRQWKNGQDFQSQPDWMKASSSAAQATGEARMLTSVISLKRWSTVNAQAGIRGKQRGIVWDQIAIADDTLGEVIDDVEARAVVAYGETYLRQLHADLVGEP